MIDWERYGSVLLLLTGLLAVAFYIRTNTEAFVTVGESLTFVFQLMIAGTVIAMLRNEGGLSTFGVFGPAILAFAWLEVGPLWGFLLIAYVFVVTATARAALSGLDLGTAHRVASLLVIAGMAAFTTQAVGQLQNIPEFSTVLLFPIILTTWYAERFVEGIAETGWAPATWRLSATVVAIAAAALVAGFDPLVSMVVRTPETWVALAGINIVLGAGTNIRAGEYLRFQQLRKALGAESTGEVLTMRTRNREFISRYNPAPLMAGFDKVKMKRFLHGLDIPTPKTFLVVRGQDELEELDTLLSEQERLVIKPVDGSGGRGVLVVRGRDGDSGTFVTNRGTLSKTEIMSHARKLCVGGVADYGARSSALVESIITPDELLSSRVESGVPDLRVIVLNGVPVMAMVRLPTVESKGTANIHTGAVAVAVDIASGKTSGGYQQTRNAFVESHPDTGASLKFEIPEWETVLEMASRAAIASSFGYTGVDIVFDAEQGPMVLEINRRPGLGIQNANMAGLLGRLRLVEAQEHTTQFATAGERVTQAMAWSRNNWKGEESATPPRRQQEQEVYQ